MRILIHILCLLLYFGVSHDIFGQAYIRDIPHLDQLPVMSVHRLLLDSEGYMWYGTVDGLCRDDGYRLHVFRNDYLHEEPLKSNLILSIAEDSLHHILFGTSSGLYYIDKIDYKIRAVDSKALGNAIVNNIFVSSDSLIFIGTQNQGSYRLEYTDDKLYKSKKLSDIELTCCDETDDHKIIGAFIHSSLCIYDRQSDKWAPLDSSGKTFHVISMTHTGRYLWLSSWYSDIVRKDLDAPDVNSSYKDIPVINPSTGKPVSFFLYLKPNKNKDMLWGTSNDDIHAFHISKSGELEPIDLRNYLSGYSSQMKMTSELISDRYGNYWVAGYDRGSFVIDTESMSSRYYPVDAINDRFSRSAVIITLCRDGESSVYWLSQEREGINLYDTSNGSLCNYRDCPSTRSLPIDMIHELIASRTPHHIWALNGGRDVVQLRSSGMSMELVHHLQLPDGERTKTIYESKDGLLWIGTYNGIFCYDPSSDRLTTVSDDIGHTTSFTETSDGRIWATITEKGICEISDNKMQKLYKLSQDLLCISSSSDGKLWVGTGSGELLCIDTSHPDVINDKNNYSSSAGLNGDMVEKIVIDRKNHLWILTNQRLTEFVPSSGTIRVINTCGPDDATTPTLPRFMPRALCLSENGEVIAGGFRGFLTVDPSTPVSKEEGSSEVKYTGISVNGEQRPMPATENLYLDANTVNLEIYFSSLDHLHARSIQYAYSLDGKEWNYLPIGKNSVSFNELAKGTHHLRVKCTNRTGLWSDRFSELSFYRAPHWYDSTFAYIIYTLLGLSLIYFIIKYFINATRKREEAIWSDSAEMVAMHNYLTKDKDTDTNSESSKSESSDDSMDFIAIDKMLIDKVKSCITNHVSEQDFNVNSLASDMNMSRSTLTRKIKAITNKTPLQLIRDVKMDIAKQMLSNRTVTVSEVAQKVGYSDRDYFAQTYKEYYGVLPNESRMMRDESRESRV